MNNSFQQRAMSGTYDSDQQVYDTHIHEYDVTKETEKHNVKYCWKRFVITRFKNRQSPWEECIDAVIWKIKPINPEGDFLVYWTILMILAIVYVILIVPLDLAFEVPLLPWIVFTLIVNAIFILDVVVNFHITYINSMGDLETDWWKIQKHYLLGWFWVDLISSFPYDLVSLIIVIDSNTSNSGIQGQLLLAVHFLIRVLLKSGVSITTFFFLLWATFVLTAHWFGCFFWWIATLEGLPNSWVYNTQHSLATLNMNSSQQLQYSTVIYWAFVTQATLGYGDITAYTYVEQIYTILVVLIGCTLYAIIVATVGQVVSSYFHNETEYTRWMDKVRSFSKSHNLPKDVEQRLNLYYEYIWEKSKTFSKEEITNQLPFELKVDVNNAIHDALFKGNPVFKKSCEGIYFQHMLASKLDAGGVKLPDDILFFEGDEVENLFIVREGLLELVIDCNTENEIIVSARKSGHYCGDMGMFDETPKHFVSCVVSQFSHIYQISKADFLTVLGNFKREEEMFVAVAKERKKAVADLLSQIRESNMGPSTKSRRDFVAFIVKPMTSLTEQTEKLWEVWEKAVSPDTDEKLCEHVIQSRFADYHYSHRSLAVIETQNKGGTLVFNTGAAPPIPRQSLMGEPVTPPPLATNINASTRNLASLSMSNEVGKSKRGRRLEVVVASPDVGKLNPVTRTTSVTDEEPGNNNLLLLIQKLGEKVDILETKIAKQTIEMKKGNL